MIFEPYDKVKTIRIFSTIGFCENVADSLCPVVLTTFIRSPQSSILALDSCSKCISNVFVGEKNAWELNITRTSFENGVPEEDVVDIIIHPRDSLVDWQKTEYEVKVRNDT